MKARDVDTVMSIIAVVFVAAVFLLTARPVADIVAVGLFIAAPTKFISIARMLDIAKGK
jgi:hypothetical protein